jgi:hypothetical protein
MTIFFCSAVLIFVLTLSKGFYHIFPSKFLNEVPIFASDTNLFVFSPAFFTQKKELNYFITKSI